MRDHEQGGIVRHVGILALRLQEGIEQLKSRVSGETLLPPSLAALLGIPVAFASAHVRHELPDVLPLQHVDGEPLERVAEDEVVGQLRRHAAKDVAEALLQTALDEICKGQTGTGGSDCRITPRRQ